MKKQNYSLGFECEELVKKCGGKRINSGAKLKYNEPTKTISFRVPISKIEEIKVLIKENLTKHI
jgi:hypothetical protein